MKVIVFGATGGTGNLVVQQALENGFEVTAFVRNPEKLKIKNDVRVFVFDITHPLRRPLKSRQDRQKSCSNFGKDLISSISILSD